MNVVYPPNGSMPAPLGTISDLLNSGTQATTPVKVFFAHNLGQRTFLLSIPMFEFYRMSDVANDREKHGAAVAQRKLDPEHARKLAVYILKGLVSTAVMARENANKPVPDAFLVVQKHLGTQPYLSLQPIVANLRSCKKFGENIPGSRMLTQEGETACFKVFMSQQDVLFVVDGQHRRKAMDLVFNFLDYIRSNQSYPKKRQSLYSGSTDETMGPDELMLWTECYDMARAHASVQVELHLGLDPDEERQLFHDLNNLGKKVEKNLALAFDNSNPVNNFIKHELVDSGVVTLTDKEVKNWDEDTGAIAHKELIAVNAHLFLNKTNVSSATPAVVEERTEIAKRFWTAVVALPGFGEEGARRKTVAAQPVVLKALAKLTFDFAWGRHAAPTLLEKLLSGITTVDFGHNNPMWRYYEFTPEQRAANHLDGLSDFLPSVEDGNRDVGGFQGGLMRFGAKHNDIFPLIGDMLRWKLGLPNRREVGE